MAIQAPLCRYSGCGNRTWEGLCFHHKSGGAPGSTDDSSIPSSIPTPYFWTHNSHDSIADTWTALVDVFPDINNVIHPYNVRDQIVSLLTASTSTECYRLVSGTDVVDYDERNKRISGVISTTVDQLHLQPNILSDEDAVFLSNSSYDSLGRSISDSRELASYGLRMEWELGRMMKVPADPNGVDYRIPFEDFCNVTAPYMDQEVKLQSMKEMSRYPDIIESLSGSRPKNPNALPPNLCVPPDNIVIAPFHEIEQIALQSDYEMQAQAREDLEAKRQEQMDAIKGWIVDTVMDRKGHRARRKARNKDSRKRAAAAAQAQRDASLARKANKMTVENIKYLNKKRRGW